MGKSRVVNRLLSTVRALGVPSIVLLCGCSNAKEVTAWPGMEVAEFNRLNEHSTQPMELGGDDWIGIDSPVTLVVRQRGETIRFVGTRLGGGLQVASSDLAIYGAQPGKAVLNTIAFNIGGGMEDISGRQALLTEKCDQLARIAGLPQKTIPDAITLGARLRAAKGSMVEVCGGEGRGIVFQISATHHYDHRSRRGTDYGWAYFDGYLGLPFKGDGEQGSAFPAAGRR